MTGKAKPTCPVCGHEEKVRQMRPPKCEECGQRMMFMHSERANENGTATLELMYACPTCAPEYFEKVQ